MSCSALIYSLSRRSKPDLLLLDSSLQHHHLIASICASRGHRSHPSLKEDISDDCLGGKLWEKTAEPRRRSLHPSEHPPGASRWSAALLHPHQVQWRFWRFQVCPEDPFPRLLIGTDGGFEALWVVCASTHRAEVLHRDPCWEEQPQTLVEVLVPASQLMVLQPPVQPVEVDTDGGHGRRLW